MRVLVIFLTFGACLLALDNDAIFLASVCLFFAGWAVGDAIRATLTAEEETPDEDSENP